MSWVSKRILNEVDEICKYVRDLWKEIVCIHENPKGKENGKDEESEEDGKRSEDKSGTPQEVEGKELRNLRIEEINEEPRPSTLDESSEESSTSPRGEAESK